MQGEPPVPCAPCNSRTELEEAQESFREQERATSPPPPPPSDPQWCLFKMEPDAQPRLTPNWPWAHRPQKARQRQPEPSRGTPGFEKKPPEKPNKTV